MRLNYELEFLNEDKIFITRKKWEVEPMMSINQLEEFQSDIFEDLPKVVKKSFSLMIERTNKYKIDICLLHIHDCLLSFSICRGARQFCAMSSAAHLPPLPPKIWY